MLVAGPPGLGKTVLLDAAEVMARERGIRVFRGAGDAAARVIPFGPLFDALLTAPDAPVDPAVLRDLSQSPEETPPDCGPSLAGGVNTARAGAGQSHRPGAGQGQPHSF